MKQILLDIILVLLLHVPTYAQNDTALYSEIIKPRVRVIIDNDFGGDPDGLFQLAHHLLSPTVEIRGIIGSQNYKGGFYGAPGTSAYSITQVNELLKVMHLSGKYPVYQGSNTGLTNTKTPVISEGAKAIVQEAMRNDSQLPLYVVCGAGLTCIASACLMEPEIANKITLVWIGGPEYEGLAIPPPGTKNQEYNLSIDTKAAQVIYNVSTIPIWQVPRDAYRQALYSYPEIAYRIKTSGVTGKFLVEKLDVLLKRAKRSLGEAYVLGDSPLVLLTALQSAWDSDPSSSKYVTKPAPIINDAGVYVKNPKGRNIRVYTNLDTRLMFEDLVAKLALLNMKK